MTSTLAVQMFTLRDFTKTRKDFAETLNKIKAIGYPAVQFSAVGCMGGERPEVPAADARKLLDDAGLKCVATHRAWEALSGQTEAEIEFHKTIGCAYAAIGSLPGTYKDAGAQGYRQFIRDAAPVIRKLNAAGIAFGYHNHSFEFLRVGPGQKTGFDIFVDEADAAFTMEVDTYWVQHGGRSPERTLERLTGRVPVIHLKDMGIDREKGPVMAAVGEGNLEWHRILPAAAKAHVRWYCVEQDWCPRDPFDCLKSSFDFLAARGA